MNAAGGMLQPKEGRAAESECRNRWIASPDPDVMLETTMANKSSKATWASVKTRLQQLDRGALVSLLGDIYRSSPENRRFLLARLLGSQIELDKYRKLGRRRLPGAVQSASRSRQGSRTAHSPLSPSDKRRRGYGRPGTQLR